MSAGSLNNNNDLNEVREWFQIKIIYVFFLLLSVIWPWGFPISQNPPSADYSLYHEFPNAPSPWPEKPFSQTFEVRKSHLRFPNVLN